MVCGLRLALSSFIAAQSLSGSWVELAVRVQSFPKVIRVMGRWEWVGVSCDGTWDSGLGVKTMGEGGLRFWRQGLNGTVMVAL
ncbi:hypothetical protein Tco_0126307, partial [Tanacetum coccineum]